MAKGKKTGAQKEHQAARKNVEAKAKGAAPAEALVLTDRRATADRRKSSTDRREKDIPVPVERRKLERRAKVARRRQIDPTTCERDYSVDEVEFMSALNEYKRTSGRMFPTCSEILEVIRGLGYEKRRADSENAATPATASQPAHDAHAASTVPQTAP